MGNILKKGWETTVDDLNDEDVDGNITLDNLYFVAKYFATSVDSNGDATVGAVLMKCLSSACLSTVKCSCTRKPFLDFCNKVIVAVMKYGNSLAATQNELLRKAVEKVANTIVEKAVNPVVKRFFTQTVENAVPACTAVHAAQSGNGALNQLAGEVLVEEAVENISKLTLAKSSAKSALKWGFVVEGACLAYTIYDSHTKLKKKEITSDQYTRTVVKRSSGAAASLGGGAVGSFVGTLVLPGFGSFVGGFVGGVAGDYLGSWLGEKAYENS